MQNQFSERLIEILHERKISQNQLGKAIGVSSSTVSDWANGKIQPTAENIFLIAVYFGVSADYLLGLE